MREDDEFFEKENGLATREVYDKQDQLDTSRRKKQQKRQQNIESVPSSSESVYCIFITTSAQRVAH